MPLISVIILTYNYEQYIQRCIYSILNGTYQNVEVILVNNGSTDNTRAVIEQLMAKDSRITYVHLPNNVGIFAGRIEGMKVAKGEYIGFSDADDYYEPNSFEVLYNTSQHYQADIVTAHTVRNKKNHHPINNTFPFSIHENDEVLRSYLQNNPYSNLWCALFHRKLVEKALECYPQNIHMLGGEDYIHNIFLHFFASKKVQIEVPIYHWCLNIRSTSASTTAKKNKAKTLEDYQNVYLIVEQFLHNQNKYDVFKNSWRTFIYIQILPLFMEKRQFNYQVLQYWEENANTKFLLELLIQYRKKIGVFPNNLGKLPIHKQIIWCVKHSIKIVLRKIMQPFKKKVNNDDLFLS